MIASIKLRNGLQVPQIGIGTWQITDRTVMNSVICNATGLGYKLIDTAAAYSNEIAIAKAIAESSVSRDSIMLSDKVWNTCRGYMETQEACKRSLKKLKTDYFDIYLIHWPASPKLHEDWREINAETWRGMEQLYKDGFVRSIGVCNFKEHHLEELSKTASILPFINQIEFHPGFRQNELVSYCKKNNIQIEASSPLGNGQILSNEVLLKLAEKYGKTPAQICLRWIIQGGYISIPKTQNVDRLKENIDVFDFIISNEDVELINSIPYCGGIGLDSDEVTDFG